MRVNLFIIILVWAQAASYAQDARTRFKNYSLEDGLSQSTVYAVLQDNMGFIWIGTRDGLNRFDNNSFLTFYPSFDSAGSLSYRSVRALVQDHSGFIWVGTDGGGVDRLDPVKQSFQNICAIIGSSDCDLETNITSLDIKGNLLYIGTRNQGLYTFDIKTHELDNTLQLVSTIWDIEISGGKVLLATSEGVVTINDDLSTEHYLEGHEIRTLKASSASRILIGSRTSGLHELDLSSGQVDIFSQELSGIEISSLEIDKDEQVWVGTDEKGVFLLSADEEVIAHLNSENKPVHNLPSESIRSIYKDLNGMIWVGTNNAGVSNYYEARYQFISYSARNTQGAVLGDIILSFNQLDSGKLLVGTEQHGLFTLDETDLYLEKSEALANSSIIAILKDHNARIWVATDREGLILIEDQNQLDQIKQIEGITNPSVLSLEQAPNGDILAGTYKGLNIIREGRVLDMDFIPDYLQEDRILAIHTINKGEFLLGTFSNGVVHFNHKESLFTRYTSGANSSHLPDKKIPERVQAIYEDSKGRTWLGTYSGLALFDATEGSFTLFTTRDGLPSDVVYGILEDQKGNLWLSTNSGISSFNADSLVFKNYSLLDGLSSKEFNGGAYFKDEKGKMYFGSINGFTVFDPEQIMDSNIGGEIVIHSMNVDGTKYNPLSKNEFMLGSGKEYIQFDFSYLNFINSDKYQLQYQLEGLSSKWIPIRSNLEVNFSGLPFGDYELRIKALNSDKEQVSLSNNVKFYIQAPLWMRWYFILAVAILLTVAITVLFKYRMYYLLKEETTRNRIARALHDDLSATLSSISFFSEAARRKRKDYDKAEEYITMIEKSAEEAKEKINDIIWAIDPEQDDSRGLLMKCKRFAGEMFESKDIAYDLDFDDELNIPSDLDTRQHLWLIFKELVNNLVRHSDANHAKVSMKKEASNLILEIEDNGIGLNKDLVHSGRGISNLRHRAGHLGAELTHSTPEKGGTKWQLMIPL